MDSWVPKPRNLAESTPRESRPNKKFIYAVFLFSILLSVAFFIVWVIVYVFLNGFGRNPYPDRNVQRDLFILWLVVGLALQVFIAVIPPWTVYLFGVGLTTTYGNVTILLIMSLIFLSLLVGVLVNPAILIFLTVPFLYYTIVGLTVVARRQKNQKREGQ